MKRFPYARLNQMIDQHGWIITGVPGAAMYTVGLVDKFSHPELAIQGLPAQAAGGILRIAVSMIRNGVRYDELGEVSGLIRGYQSRLVRVHPSNYPDWFGMALAYHVGSFNMIQIVWPDQMRRFPEDPLFKGDEVVLDRRSERYLELAESHTAGCPCHECLMEI